MKIGHELKEWIKPEDLKGTPGIVLKCVVADSTATMQSGKKLPAVQFEGKTPDGVDLLTDIATYRLVCVNEPFDVFTGKLYRLTYKTDQRFFVEPEPEESKIK